MNGSIGRSDRGARRGWLGVMAVLTAVALVVTACQAGQSATPGATPPGGATASATGGDKPYAGVTLNMLMEDLTETHYVADLLPDFEAKTGIKVVFEQVPYSNMYEKLVPQLSGPEKSGSYDVEAVANLVSPVVATSRTRAERDAAIAAGRAPLRDAAARLAKRVAATW